MTDTQLDSAAADPATSRFLPILLALFVGSGCAALIYEIVWLQLLQLVIGSSTISVGVLLGTFMGGMCLGSYLLPRFVSRDHHPLKVYAYLELGIGAIGLLVLFGMPLVSYFYTSIAGTGTFSIVLRGFVAGVCLLPPTLLMGATLPAIARWVETTPKGIGWLGFFYGGNIAGAVMGSLLAGFYLLRLYDMNVTTYVAVAINVCVALLALTIAKATPHAVVPPAKAVEASPGSRTIYLVIALSGFTALGSEVIWTRLLSLVFGATVYTFSLILAVFLVGLGIGSSLGAGLARTLERPRVALGWFQILLCAASAWAAYQLNVSLPYWPINPSISTGAEFTFQLDLVRCFWVVLPGAILWGASFPLALASVARKGQDPARLVGGVYAANTVGAIVGALSVSLVLVSWFHSQGAQQILIAVSAIAGLLTLAPIASGDAKGKFSLAAATALVLATAGAAYLVKTVQPISPLLVAYGRYSATWVGQSDIFYVGEGVTASVAVSRMPNGVLNYHNAGKVQASSEPQDMRLQRMLGHFTTLLSDHPYKIVVIGCGAGVTAGAVSIDPHLQSETIAEIEPLVPKVVSKYFGEHNFNVVDNPKVHIHIDDARHYILTTNEKFDALTSDPLDPWVKGAATLYTREFFERVKEHLNPGGIVTLFVQLYESNPAAVKSEIATFMQAFPQGIIWGNTQQGKGYDLVLFGQLNPQPIDIDALDRKLSSPEYEGVAESLREVGFNSALDLLATYAGQGPDLGRYMQDAEINSDRNLRLQFLAGLGLNLYQSDPIYVDILRDRKSPVSLFTGSPEHKQALLDLIARSGG